MGIILMKIIDWSGGVFAFISTALNWGNVKGDISFALGAILTIVTIIKYCREWKTKDKKNGKKRR